MRLGKLVRPWEYGYIYEADNMLVKVSENRKQISNEVKALKLVEDTDVLPKVISVGTI